MAIAGLVCHCQSFVSVVWLLVMETVLGSVPRLAGCAAAVLPWMALLVVLSVLGGLDWLLGRLCVWVLVGMRLLWCCCLTL